ncbi:hypothetical protein QJ854_gp345 [Moumouvirus goulette]|uniref:Repeat protein n=1 Tax=Moumouvirus goulette TaxID=1247379 RepID=M1PXG1_9VIRU|nr:hypothetical protein QJ854_gp345 [Moumouvirus goulette]AGF85437.1 hypothetical protein glt_00628 [Moumouvirus goulette]
MTNYLRIYHMENIGNYDTYCNELSINNTKFIKFEHVSNTNNDLLYLQKLFSLDISDYTSERSLLVTYESNYICEFSDNKPVTLIKYKILLNLGSSNNPDDLSGLLPNNLKNFDNCNFYGDYFSIYPKNIIEYECDFCCNDKNIVENKWCKKCNGSFYNAKNLWDIIFNEIHFSEICKNSVLYIKKIYEPIDYENKDSLIKVLSFLHDKKEKIEILQERINRIDNKINIYIERMNFKKKYNQTIINNLVSDKGGSVDNFLSLIKNIEKNNTS